MSEDPIGFDAGPNFYSYVGGNPLSYVDPLGLWAFGFEAYAGLGGGLTFGRDAVTGQPFLNIRFGYGFGGCFDYDPLAKRPGSDPCDMGSGEAFGLYGKAGWSRWSGKGRAWL